MGQTRKIFPSDRIVRTPSQRLTNHDLVIYLGFICRITGFSSHFIRNMKAQTKLEAPRVPELGMAVDQFRVSKSRLQQEKSDEEEMLTCFLKLRELVPSIPANKKLSKVQLLQHVIDYIMDLELTLDCNFTKVVTPVLVSAAGTERRPLAETNNRDVLTQNDDLMETDSEGSC